MSSPAESGFRGYVATLEKYGKRRMDAWRRSGGRKPNSAYLEAGTGRGRARPLRVKKRKEVPMAD